MATVPCSTDDYLEQDRPIPGQNFACLSFISPEQVLERKEMFLFKKFIGAFSKDIRVMVDGLKEKYPEEADGIRLLEERHSYMFDVTGKAVQEEYAAFVAAHPQLETEFHETNDFQTSIRGIKVRGVYDTLREAQVRSEVLRRGDKNHNIYIAQVGAWCPWSPHPDQVPNQEYTETHLNTLMKKYMENQMQRDEYYQSRKESLRKDAMRRAAELTEKVNTETATAIGQGVVLDYTDELKANVEPTEILNTPETWTAGANEPTTLSQ